MTAARRAPKEAQTALAEVIDLPIQRIASYLVVAESLDTQLITAVQRLVNGLAGTPYASRVQWLGAWRERGDFA